MIRATCTSAAAGSAFVWSATAATSATAAPSPTTASRRTASTTAITADRSSPVSFAYHYWSGDGFRVRNPEADSSLSLGGDGSPLRRPCHRRGDRPVGVRRGAGLHAPL